MKSEMFPISKFDDDKHRTRRVDLNENLSEEIEL